MWVSPHDGSVSHVMVRRYVMQAQCSDASGECYLQFFNDQVAQPHASSGAVQASLGTAWGSRIRGGWCDALVH